MLARWLKIGGPGLHRLDQAIHDAVAEVYPDPKKYESARKLRAWLHDELLSMLSEDLLGRAIAEAKQNKAVVPRWASRELKEARQREAEHIAYLKARYPDLDRLQWGPPPPGLALAYPDVISHLARVRRLAAFSQLFADLIPDDAGISRIAYCLDATMKIIMDEFKDR